MSMQSAKVMVPPPVNAPPAARWASGLVAALARTGHRVWTALEDVGRRRAERELDRLAGPAATDTERTRMLRQAMRRDSST